MSSLSSDIETSIIPDPPDIYSISSSRQNSPILSNSPVLTITSVSPQLPAVTGESLVAGEGYSCYVCIEPIDIENRRSYRAPCACSGETKYVHTKCFKELCKYNQTCTICKLPYAVSTIYTRPNDYEMVKYQRFILYHQYRIYRRFVIATLIMLIIFTSNLYSINNRVEYKCSITQNMREDYEDNFLGELQAKISLTDKQNVIVYFYNGCDPSLSPQTFCRYGLKQDQQKYIDKYMQADCYIDLNEISNSRLIANGNPAKLAEMAILIITGSLYLIYIIFLSMNMAAKRRMEVSEIISAYA